MRFSLKVLTLIVALRRMQHFIEWAIYDFYLSETKFVLNSFLRTHDLYNIYCFRYATYIIPTRNSLSKVSERKYHIFRQPIM